MNLAALRNYVKNRYPSDMTDTEINDHINEVYKDLTMLFTPDTTEESTLSTVASTGEYSMSVNTRRIKEVHLSSGGVRNRLWSTRREALVYPRDTGTPLRWYPVGMAQSAGDVKQRFGLDPIPAAGGDSIIVQFEPEPADLTGDSDSPRYIPEEFHNLIAYGALSLVSGKAQDYNVSTNWQQRYSSAYNDTMQKLGKIATTNFPDMAKAGGQ